jgi:protein-S-isoprenylcysteine O-methyltransferase Ste14
MTRAAVSEVPPRTDSVLGSFPSDHANVAAHPPVIWILLLAAGCALDFLLPLTFLPSEFPAVWVGGAVWLLGFGLAALAIAQFRRAGVDERTNTPTARLVDTGAFAFSRNPIYVGAYIATVGVAIIYNMLWILATLVPFCLAVRYGVVAREEAYLERNFGNAYLAYKARVRRWI